MPRIRPARRSGWKISSASVFSPVPRNLTGSPVTALIESAAPPRASPSILVRTRPVNGTAAAKAWATPTASWPVIASTTSSVSTGLTAAVTSAISAISASSTVSRPAVSRITDVARLAARGLDALAGDVDDGRARRCAVDGDVEALAERLRAGPRRPGGTGRRPRGAGGGRA